MAGQGPVSGSAVGLPPRSRLAVRDLRLLAVARSFGDAPPVARAARGLSWAGEHGALWVVTGLAAAAADASRRGQWARATAVVAGAHVASMAVKRVVRRPRPDLPGGPLVRTAGRHSFPSSHAASSVAAAVAFRGLVPRTSPVASAIGVAAAGVCASRLVVGVHYPSDVLAGAALGAVTAAWGRGWVARGARDV